MPLKNYSEDAPRSLSSLLLVEINRAWSRERRILAPSAIDLPLGAVLAENAQGELTPYLNNPGDSQAEPPDPGDSRAVAVSLEDKKAGPNAQPVMVMARGAVLAASELFFLESVSPEQQAEAKAQLRALGLVCQE